LTEQPFLRDLVVHDACLPGKRPVGFELSAEEKARVAQLADRWQARELLATDRILIEHRIVDEQTAADVQRREAKIHLKTLNERAPLRLPVCLAGGEGRGIRCVARRIAPCSLPESRSRLWQHERRQSQDRR